MGLSTSKQFLLEASRQAGTQDYFRWRAIGEGIGYSEAQSLSAVKSLDEQKLLILLIDGTARLLDAGRVMAGRLEGKAAANQPTPSRSKGRRN